MCVKVVDPVSHLALPCELSPPLIESLLHDGVHGGDLSVVTEGHGLAQLRHLLLLQAVADVLHDFLDPERLILLDLFVPEEQHVWVLLSLPGRL